MTACVLLTGAIVAGFFGAKTLSRYAWAQVAVGIFGLIGVCYFAPMTGAA